MGDPICIKKIQTREKLMCEIRTIMSLEELTATQVKYTTHKWRQSSNNRKISQQTQHWNVKLAQNCFYLFTYGNFGTVKNRKCLELEYYPWKWRKAWSKVTIVHVIKTSVAKRVNWNRQNQGLKSLKCNFSSQEGNFILYYNFSLKM